MALSMTVAVRQIRALIAGLDEVSRAYAASESDVNGLPSAIEGDFPAVLVMPGPDIGPYILMQGGQRHTYEVQVLVLCGRGELLAEKAALMMPIVDAIIDLFTGNVTLGGRVNSVLYDRQGGMADITFAGQTYPGVEIALRVSEQATATVAVGS